MLQHSFLVTCDGHKIFQWGNIVHSVSESWHILSPSLLEHRHTLQCHYAARFSCQRVCCIYHLSERNCYSLILTTFILYLWCEHSNIFHCIVCNLIAFCEIRQRARQQDSLCTQRITLEALLVVLTFCMLFEWSEKVSALFSRSCDWPSCAASHMATSGLRVPMNTSVTWSIAALHSYRGENIL